MARFELREDFTRHPMTLRLCRFMGSENAFGHVVGLWCWALGACPSGDLAGLDGYAIELAVRYLPLDGKCYAALVASGFVLKVDGKPAGIYGWDSRDGLVRLQITRIGSKAYGHDWPRIRLAIVLRDGERCQAIACGAFDDLEVHHRRPLRLFNGDLGSANDPANLITLCRVCHARADADFRRSERRAERTAP